MDSDKGIALAVREKNGPASINDAQGQETGDGTQTAGVFQAIYNDGKWGEKGNGSGMKLRRVNKRYFL